MRRRKSWVEQEARVAKASRDGFQKGVVRGLLGMALAGLTNGRLTLKSQPLPPWKRIPTLEQYYAGRIPAAEIDRLRKECAQAGKSSWRIDAALRLARDSLHRATAGVPPGCPAHGRQGSGSIGLCRPCRLPVSGTVRTMRRESLHELCSGQAIAPGQGGVPSFDREKCVHCGACLWNCAQPVPGNPDRTNIAFRAGTGGLHSAIN